MNSSLDWSQQVITINRSSTQNFSCLTQMLWMDSLALIILNEHCQQEIVLHFKDIKLPVFDYFHCFVLHYEGFVDGQWFVESDGIASIIFIPTFSCSYELEFIHSRHQDLFSKYFEIRFNLLVLFPKYFKLFLFEVYI